MSWYGRQKAVVKHRNPVHIRWMIRYDMPEVLAIEYASFARPMTEDKMLEALRHHSCIGMVAEHRERVVGFMVYETTKDRILLLDFAVDPPYRRDGVGAQMAAKLVGKLSAGRRETVGVRIRETNLPGQLFFRSVGFRAVGVGRGDFGDSGEDSYAMEYKLNAADEKEGCFG